MVRIIVGSGFGNWQAGVVFLVQFDWFGGVFGGFQLWTLGFDDLMKLSERTLFCVLFFVLWGLVVCSALSVDTMIDFVVSKTETQHVENRPDVFFRR